MKKKVKEIMTEGPACCTAEMDLPSVAKMMADFDCGEIPVVDDGINYHPVGVITDRDITCRVVAWGKNPLELKVKDCMTTPCVTVTPETTLEECCRILEDNQIRRVPVVDENGRCCGIVAQADLVSKIPKDKAAGLVSEISRSEV